MYPQQQFSYQPQRGMQDFNGPVSQGYARSQPFSQGAPQMGGYQQPGGQFPMSPGITIFGNKAQATPSAAAIPTAVKEQELLTTLGFIQKTKRENEKLQRKSEFQDQLISSLMQFEASQNITELKSFLILVTYSLSRCLPPLEWKKV
eukprot:TRINITY_DN2731_c0_g1_i2.p1 TRINITY_DN2731_c0_g1~~TRINITY_DN2731_c0_g1_i2.p1  ORF type:complete len:147 (+),score=27.30 TRINITY_DN2731_c0_g1_i2:123-563(+)